MAHTHYEFTNMVLVDTVETVYTGENKLTIQMIIVQFDDQEDTYTLTDDISATTSDTTDDILISVRAPFDWWTTIIDWSAKPRHVHGLACTVCSGSTVGYVYFA